MKPGITLLVTAAVLLTTAHRLPAPIQEVPEGPTPSPQQSAKPKPKQTIKPNVMSESLESSTKRQTSSPTPTPAPNAFAGTWVGTIKRGIFGNVDQTFVVNSAGSAVVDKSRLGSFNWQATCDGKKMTWRGAAMNASSYRWTLTPNADGKTAVVTENGPGVASSAVFHNTSP